MAKLTIDTDDLRSLTDLSRELNVGKSTVSMWIHRSDQSGFPAPALVAGRTRLWDVNEVISWLNS